MIWQAATPLWFTPEGYGTLSGVEGPVVGPDEDMLEARSMTLCPAYRGQGRCQSGCWEEPACQVDEPSEGWADTTGLVVVVPELSDPPSKM